MGNRKQIRCGECCFRSKSPVYTCDFAFITGHTRLAAPAENCRYFRKGARIEPKKGAPTVTEEPEQRKRASGGGMKPKYDWDLGRKLYDKGLNDGEIGRALGCRHHSVYEWRKRNGLPANDLPGGQRKKKQNGQDRTGQDRTGQDRRRAE